MSKPDTSGKRTAILVFLTVAFLALVSAALSVAVYFSTRDMQRALQQLPDDPGVSHLDKVLGLDRIDGIEEEGLSHVETSKVFGGDRYRWTLGHARLVVPLKELPHSLHVRLGVTVPRTVSLRIRVNDKILFDEKVALKADWSRTFDVSALNLDKRAIIEIISDTFIPAETLKNSTDPRMLGVCVRGITLVSNTQEYIDDVLGAQTKPGVLEEGFHHQEKAGNQPFRWTNGNASLDVPIRTKMPKSLELALEIPNILPDYRVQVTVNGKKLFEDQVKPNDNWTSQLPLDGVDLGNNAKIEITTSTFVPANIDKGSKDGRTLGVRVKHVMLKSEELK